MPTPKFKNGDKVHVNPDEASAYPAKAHAPGTTYIVISKGPKNYKLRPVDGPGLGTPGILAPEDILVAGEHPVSAAVAGVPYVPEVFLDPGTVVTFKRNKPEGFYVVTGYSNGHRLFPIGGSSRYYKAIKGTNLIVHTVADIQPHGHKTVITLTPKDA